MSRRHAAEKREVQPDAKYGDIVLTKFMNCLMLDGKKSAAEAIVYGALDKMAKKGGGQEALTMFHTALDNVSRLWKSARAASAVPPTRFRSKSAPSAVRLSRSAG